MSRKNDNIIEKKYNGEICGYEVKIEKDGKCYTKYFGIKKHKGKKVALENAKSFTSTLLLVLLISQHEIHKGVNKPISNNLFPQNKVNSER